MATRAAQNTYRFVNASAYLQKEGKIQVAKIAGEMGKSKVRSGLASAGMFAALMIPTAAITYADHKKMTDTLAVAEKKGMLNPETGLVLDSIAKAWNEWTADQKESLIRMSSTQILGEHVVSCTYDAKTGKVTAMIDAPKVSPKDNTVVGITSSNQIEAWKGAVKKFGLTPEIAYTRNADAYLTNQFNALAAT